MWGGSIRESEFLIFCLVVCLEVAISLRVMRPTSLMRDSWGVGGCCRVSCCILPFQKPFEE